MLFKNRARRAHFLLTALVSLLAVGAAACGDDSASSSAEAASSGTDTQSSAPAGPVRGGEATVLVPSEGATLDPARMNGSAGSDGQRGFALYGALVVMDPHASEVKPVLAESFTPDATNQVWTLELKPDIVFSDGTPYDAEAVRFNWERAQNPENRSPSLGTLRAVTSMNVESPTTLVITLDAPNAHFDRSIARVGANFIGSPTAIQGGFDFTSDAVGAGPFLLESWVRDDRMILRRNPDWRGSDGPYLDKLTLRVVPDEDQRTDTFGTGAAEAFHTAVPASVERARDSVDVAEYTSVEVPGSSTILFNTTMAPVDDVRVRKAIVQGVDWAALVETVYGEGSEPLSTFVSESSPWHHPGARLPQYDPAAAQELIDDYLVDTGASKIDLKLSTFQQPVQVAVLKFMQTSLNQLDGVTVDVEVNDSPTQIQKVRQLEHMVSTWGIPHVDPEPGLFLVTHSSSTTNYSGFTAPEIDAALEAARGVSGFDERKAHYDEVYEILVEELPYFPYMRYVTGWVTAPDLLGAEIYEDGVMRWDLLWRVL